MAGGFAGAWRKATLRQPLTPLVQPTDPSHLTPDDDDDRDPNYLDSTGAPMMPMALVDGQYEQGNVPSRYVDRTPVDHEYGVGDLPGLSQDEARRIARYAHEDDRGAVGAREYAAPGRREGTYEVVRVQNGDNAGDSPDTVMITERYGVGTGANDPDARSNIRIQRWRDRYIDMHWWTEQMRPLLVKNAQTAPELDYVADRTQWVSPYRGNLIEDPRNWETPQERRTPRQWDESMTEDGTEPQALSHNAFGLTTWGL